MTSTASGILEQYRHASPEDRAVIATAIVLDWSSGNPDRIVDLYQFLNGKPSGSHPPAYTREQISELQLLASEEQNHMTITEFWDRAAPESRGDGPSGSGAAR